ncbi:MAG: hypothetical protein K6G75_03460 [Lachnospiraceae bacterium]|nr:hypothetical protein [Lachnospiraceae bacterium]
MKNKVSKFQIVFFLSTMIIRCVFGILLGAWFFPNYFDDLLMFKYSFFGTHFRIPDYCSMVKYIGYPVFLAFVRFSHLPITLWISLLWCAVAFACFYMLCKVCKKEIVKYAGYLYILFFPSAFEYWCGLRIYRNSIIAPFVAVLFISMILIIYQSTFEENGNKIIHFVLLGFLFSFTYYLKEDGIWILACLIFWAVFGIAVSLIRLNKKDRIKCLWYIIPFAVFIVSSLCYRGVNYAAYGVFETETRNSSSPGEFCELIYGIESENRSIYVWAPEDAIEKAFEVSETLSSHPELLEKIKTSPHLGGDIKQNPIKGDHLGWVLRIALNDLPEISGEEWDEKKVCDFFQKANTEIKAAFKDGRLTKQTGRFRLLGSVGGYTFEEIAGLRNCFIDGFKGAVLLKGYRTGIMNTSGAPEMDIYSSAVEDVRNSVNMKDLDSGKASNHTGESSVLNTITEVIWWIYRIVNTVLLLSLILYLLIGVFKIPGMIRSVRKKDALPLFCYICTLSLFGIALAYDFSIVWFSAFLFEKATDMTILNFYNIALPVLLSLAYFMMIPGITGFFSRPKNKK